MANLQFLCFILCEKLSLTKRRLILLWLGDEWHPAHSMFSEQGRMGSVRRPWGRVFWSTSVLCRPWGQWGWTVVFGCSCSMNLSLDSQPANERFDLSLCWEHPAALLKSDIIICVYCPAFKAWAFSEVKARELGKPWQHGHLISPCVQPTASPNFKNLWCELCEREREDTSMPRVLGWMFINHLPFSTKFYLWNTSEMSFWLQIKM